MAKILNISDYQSVEENIKQMNARLEEFKTDITEAINVFENNQIVQEFYASGKYGTGIKERLEQIKLSVSKYVDAISNGNDSLVMQTRKYIAEQMKLLMSSSRERVSSNQMDARREEFR